MKIRSITYLKTVNRELITVNGFSPDSLNKNSENIQPQG